MFKTRQEMVRWLLGAGAATLLWIIMCINLILGLVGLPENLRGEFWWVKPFIGAINILMIVLDCWIIQEALVWRRNNRSTRLKLVKRA